MAQEWRSVWGLTLAWSPARRTYFLMRIHSISRVRALPPRLTKTHAASGLGLSRVPVSSSGSSRKTEWIMPSAASDGVRFWRVADGKLLRHVPAGKASPLLLSPDASAMLAGQGVQAAVVNHAFINRIDLETFGPLVRAASGRVVTIEDHQLVGGMGAQLAHALTMSGIAVRMSSLGIHGEFGQSAYLAEELYAMHGLTAAKMVEAALALMKA